MILLRSCYPCIGIRLCSFRSISTSRKHRTNDDLRKKLPSRKYYEELTENVYMHKQIAQSGRRAFENMVEYPIVIKKFFISDVNEEDIKYPDVLSTAEFDRLKQINAQKLDYFSKRVECSANGFPPSVYEAFKKMNLFGYNIPKGYGGEGLTHTQCTFAGEIEAYSIDAAVALHQHRLVCATITDIGTPEQCAKYLPKLANGDIIGSTAFQEWNDVNKIGLNTRAEYDDDDEEWCLNGLWHIFFGDFTQPNALIK